MPRPKPVLHAANWRTFGGIVVEALTCDRALTLAQAHRWYGLPDQPTDEDLQRLQARAGRDQTIQVIERRVRLTGDRNAPWVTVQFVVIDDATARLSWHALRQLAALAEARHLLRCLPERWEVTALIARVAGDIVPDALYVSHVQAGQRERLILSRVSLAARLTPGNPAAPPCPQQHHQLILCPDLRKLGQGGCLQIVVGPGQAGHTVGMHQVRTVAGGNLDSSKGACRALSTRRTYHEATTGNLSSFL